MNNRPLDIRQLRHDLLGLVEPLETAKMLLEIGKIEQAVRIQNAALDALKKIVQGIDAAPTFKRGGEA
jgi:hypothetical protein